MLEPLLPVLAPLLLALGTRLLALEPALFVLAPLLLVLDRTALLAQEALHPYRNRDYTRNQKSHLSTARHAGTPAPTRGPQTPLQHTTGEHPKRPATARNGATDRLPYTDPRRHQMLRLPARTHATYTALRLPRNPITRCYPY